jgi:nitrite reductase/ring-hydroxylating ferredoxin subunit
VRLGPLALIAERGARNFVLQIGEAFFHGFVVRQGGRVHGYVDRCPHAGLPLAQELDAYLGPDGRILCSWHGALFDTASGACVGGPCPRGSRLTPWPVHVEDGMLVTG